jgi:hypothetical protein
MEPPANTSPASSKELGQLEKEQALGETANLGCPRVETPNAVATAVSSGPTEIAGKTAIPGGPDAALTAATPGSAETIQT